MNKFKMYSDSGHGWLAVKLELVKQSGFVPSNFSYIKGKTIYLEEDCDAPRFLNTQGHGSYSVEEVYQGSNSPIRNYHRFVSFE